MPHAGAPSLMGRRLGSLGRPLPGRRNLVVSRTRITRAEGARCFADPTAAIAAAGGVPTLFVIGGPSCRPAASLRRPPQAHRGKADVEGDAHFPPSIRRGSSRSVARRTAPTPTTPSTSISCATAGAERDGRADCPATAETTGPHHAARHSGTPRRELSPSRNPRDSDRPRP